MNHFYSWLKSALFIIVFLTSFSSQSRDIKEILESGVIYIGFDKTELGSVNYKMAYAFADYLDLEVVEVMVDWEMLFSKDGKRPANLETDSTIRFTPDALKNVDLYCGNVSPLEWRARLFDFAPTLISAEVVVAKNDKEHAFHDITDLKGLKIAMMSGTSFVEHMKSINEKLGGSITIVETETGDQSKQMLIDGKVDGIVLDAPDALGFMFETKDEFKIQIPITAASSLVWAIEHDNPLKDEVANFMAFIKNNGALDQIFDLQYGMSYVEFESLLESHTPVKRENRDLDQILKEKKIVVSFRERDFIYHKDSEKQFVMILAEEFANYLGVEMEFVVMPSFNDYWKDSEGNIVKDSSYTPEMFNHFDLACDMFAPLEWRQRKVDLVKIYQTDYAIIAKPSTVIKSVEDLKSLRGVTSKNTSYAELLAERGISNLIYTKINNMVPSVESGRADYTLIYNAFLYPNLQPKLSFGSTNICWGVRYNQPQLKKALEQFISESSKNGLLKALGAISKGEINTSIEDYLKTYYSASQKGTLPHIVVDAKSGLPQEDVNCMYQDNKGFLWFGTRFGVVSYNGKKMKKYYVGNGLISNIINDITQDSNGNMLIATDKGLSVISHADIANYPYSNAIKNIYIDANHKVWLICTDGIAVFDGDEIISQSNLKADKYGQINSFQEVADEHAYMMATSNGLYLLKGDKVNSILSGNVNYAFIDSDGALWFNKKDGTFYCRKGISSISKAISINEKTGIPVSPIHRIKEGFHGSIWLQNTHNLYQVTSINQEAIKYTTGRDLINNGILSSLQDREQNLWIGYNGGLQKIRNNKSLRNFFPKKLDYYISSIAIDNNNDIWITSNNGLFVYDNAEETLSKKKGLIGRSFVRQMNNDDLIIVNEGGIYNIGDNKELKLKQKYNFSGLSGAFLSTNESLFVWNDLGELFYLENLDAIPVPLNINDVTKIVNIIEFDGKVYIATLNQIFRFTDGKLEKIYQHNKAISGIGHSYDKVYFASQGNIYTLDKSEPVFTFYKNLVVKDIIPSQNRSYVWISTNKGVSYFNVSTGQQYLNIASSDGLQGDEIVDNGLYIDKSGILWILTYHGVSNYNLRSLTKVKYAPKCYLSQITVGGQKVDSSKTSFKYYENDFIFNLSGIFFSNEKSVRYEYYLRGERKTSNFIRQTKENILYYDNLEPGDYELVFRAKGEDDIWSESKSYKFTIEKAIWDTWLFRIIALLLIIGVIILIYRWRLSRMVKQKQQLEELVEKRTEDLVEANELVTKKNSEITSSIHYAERIQQSLLPKQALFNRRFSDHFIIFMPRDIVSGDFFWAYEKGDMVYISVVDCTGHGVPGAFMSMLGMSFLKEIVERHENARPGVMLNDLRSEVIRALQQDGEESEAKDGMDMSLVSVNTKTLVLEYAGANNSIIISRKEPVKMEVEPENKLRKRSDVLFEIQPDKMPIAIYEKMTSFSTVRVQLIPGDSIYLFSDGFPDQFGGPKNKKLMQKRLRQTLEEHHLESMEEQKKALMKLFNDWKGNEPQVDDVTVIGWRV